MGLVGKREMEHTVVRTYGRGSILGLLSPILAFFMASRGMNGWQQSAVREMERDAVEMARRGYRVVSSEEREIPLFGAAWFRVTYELNGPPP
jgi:hypothetical protein